MSRQKTRKPWDAFTIEEKVRFWRFYGLSDPEITQREKIEGKKLQEIYERLGIEPHSLEERIRSLHFLGRTPSEIAYEIRIPISPADTQAVLERLGLKPNSEKPHNQAFHPKSEPDPSH